MTREEVVRDAVVESSSALLGLFSWNRSFDDRFPFDRNTHSYFENVEYSSNELIENDVLAVVSKLMTFLLTS